MPNDNDTNGNAALLAVAEDAMRFNCGGHGIDNLASCVLSRYPELRAEGETVPEFQRRLAAALVRAGYQGADRPGWTVPQPSSELRAAEEQAAAFSLEGASPGHRAGLHAKPPPTQQQVDQAALSLIDRASKAGEEERLADLLAGPAALSSWDERLDDFLAPHPVRRMPNPVSKRVRATRPGVRKAESPFGSRGHRRLTRGRPA
jgi:hypothetical protein